MFAKENFAQSSYYITNCDTIYFNRCVRYDRPFDKQKAKNDLLLNKLTIDTVFKKSIPTFQIGSITDLSALNKFSNGDIGLLKNNYTQSLGVLCKAEYQFQKTTSIPLRLRLGSLDYTNYLEQKPNALKPPY
jgi:hypothetical protein